MDPESTMIGLQITVANCNSLDQALIDLKTGCLNVKHGPNGIGKSTIAKAILGAIRLDGTLDELLPFKFKGKPATITPSVKGHEPLKTALVFDEDYVNQFAFQQDEVVKNSFEIFVRTIDFDETIRKIDILLDGIKSTFKDNAELEQTIADLKTLRDAFGTPNRDGSIPKSSKLIKAFGSGNKIDNVPESLIPYQEFVKSKNPSKWIGWQVKGLEFLDIAKKCPFCAVPFLEEQQDTTVRTVEKEYDAATVNHLNTLKEVIERLGKYFSQACQDNLAVVVAAKTELTVAQKGFLTTLKVDLDALIQQLESLRSISFFALRDVDQLDEKVALLRIDLSMIDKLDSASTRAITEPINQKIDDLLKRIGELKGHVGKQKAQIARTIKENQASINDFLASAGYKYLVQLNEELDTYKMKLIHRDSNEHVSSAAKHLSYGERNAFALVLFMHQVSSENPDLVILDDPISSFDKNKKFAIMHQLFRGKASLKGRTTLMLTHDLEPAIDLIGGTVKGFGGAHPWVTFLHSQKGAVSELEIKRSDIRTFGAICSDICTRQIDPLIKAIYLRRFYEISENKGPEYNLLASLFHKRAAPTVLGPAGQANMIPEEIAVATASIQVRIPEFDYAKLLAIVTDNAQIISRYHATNVGYEKIQLFRLTEATHEDDIIRKFINESYHIENEYVMQLDPYKFESVPEYVIAECDRVLLNG
jgi:ABC-type multidrug transport system ATPase subunit